MHQNFTYTLGCVIGNISLTLENNASVHVTHPHPFPGPYYNEKEKVLTVTEQMVCWKYKRIGEKSNKE